LVTVGDVAGAVTGNGEVLAVVDEDDQPVDQAARSRVHEEALRHRAVHVLLSDGEGQMWLQKRSQGKRTYPGRWTSSASGHVPVEDTLRQAARREVREELGVAAPTLAYLGWLYLEDLDLGEREFSHVFAGAHAGPFAVQQAEVAGVATFPPGELDERVVDEPGAFAASFREIWQAARAGELEGETSRLEL
jgi:isopentenyl-diphosphate delta-isomerase type 1